MTQDSIARWRSILLTALLTLLLSLLGDTSLNPQQ